MPKGGVIRIKSELLLRAIFASLLELDSVQEPALVNTSVKNKGKDGKISWIEKECCIFLQEVTKQQLMDLTNKWTKEQKKDDLLRQLVCAKYPSGYIGVINSSSELAIVTQGFIDSISEGNRISEDIFKTKENLRDVLREILLDISIFDPEYIKNNKNNIGIIKKLGNGVPTDSRPFNQKILIAKDIFNKIYKSLKDNNKANVKNQCERFFESIFGIGGEYEFKYATESNLATPKLRQDLAAICNSPDSYLLRTYKSSFPKENCTEAQISEFIHNLIQPDTLDGNYTGNKSTKKELCNNGLVLRRLVKLITNENYT
ncbi:MAG: hypothetical protein AAFQ80_19260 [Cyanobacteria bacterium J06621_8]